MKKVLSLLFFSCCMAFPLFPVDVTTKHIAIQGGIDRILEVDIEPIASQSQSYIAGMPFNILDPQVKYNLNSDGRVIAYWNLLTNFPDFRIIIEAQPLHHEQEAAFPTSGKYLPYILTFSYTMSLATGRNAIDSSFIIDLESDASQNGVTFISEDLVTGYRKYEVSLLSSSSSGTEQYANYSGVLGGQIFFKFTQASSEKVNSSDYPGGLYEAYVRVTLEAVE